MNTAIQRNARSILFGTFVLFLAGGCASVDRVQYPNSANPQEEISNLEQQMQQTEAAQYDVLAPKEYDQSLKHLNSAKKDLAKKQMDEFWNELGTAKAYLDKAGQTAANRAQRVQGVMQARQKAIDAGARRFGSTRNALHEIDEGVKADAASLDKSRFNGEVWNRAVVQYGALHINSVRAANLSEARDLIKTARDRGANRYAPKTLNEAEIALKRAERSIAEQPENPSAYSPLVTRATELSRYLIAVTATARKASGETNEEVAREAVARNQALASTRAELQGADAEAAVTRAALARKDASLRGLAAANVGLRSEQEWNQAIEEARAEFDEKEADVYRQGDKLLIRLKSIHFPTGQAKVPEHSKELLTKVSSVIEELNAKNVEVQGHTDATGSAAVNKKVSKDRAEAVAEYLGDKVDDVNVKAVGYGYEKPIAANKTKQGRAQNRRVDIVIVPTKVGASEDAE